MAATLSLRPFYNAAERISEPNTSGSTTRAITHATQAWADYIPWLDALATFSAAELAELRQNVADYVLAALEANLRSHIR